MWPRRTWKRTARAEVTGSGDISVNATGELTAVVSGSGDIKYTGGASVNKERRIGTSSPCDERSLASDPCGMLALAACGEPAPTEVQEPEPTGQEPCSSPWSRTTSGRHPEASR